jgi:hypothetical protein
MVSKSNKIYASTTGALVKNEQLALSVNGLAHHRKNIRNALEVDSLRPPMAISDAQADLLELCDNCLKVGEKLVVRLKRLEVKEGEKHRRWRSIRQALKSELGKRELNEMRDSLARYKCDLMLFILIAVQYVP